MTALSHWPTDMPERRAASRAVSRACGLMPLTCHGADRIRLPALPSAEKRIRRSGAVGGPWIPPPSGVPDAEFFQTTVNSRLRAGRRKFHDRSWGGIGGPRQDANPAARQAALNVDVKCLRDADTIRGDAPHWNIPAEHPLPASFSLVFGHPTRSTPIPYTTLSREVYSCLTF